MRAARCSSIRPTGSFTPAERSSFRRGAGAFPAASSELLENLGVHVTQLELRLRLLYAKLNGEIISDPPLTAEPPKEEQTKFKGIPWANAVSRTAILRSSEELLLPGQPVCVIGPALEQPTDQGGSRSVAIQKGHPSNPFIIGAGGPADLLKASGTGVGRDPIGIGCLLVGAGMMGKCYYDSRLPAEGADDSSTNPAHTAGMVILRSVATKDCISLGGTTISAATDSSCHSLRRKQSSDVVVHHAHRLHEGITDR